MSHPLVADLHNHTTASDGDYTPFGLVQKGKELGLTAIAITDHDTLAGLPEGLEAGAKLGINVVTGVEVTVRFRRDYFVGSLHLLLYFSPSLLDDTTFVNDVNAVLSQGRGSDLVRERVSAINESFGPDSDSPRLSRSLSFEDISSYSENVTRRHFALALSEKHGLTSRESVNELIGNDSIAYVPAGIDLPQVQPLLEKYAFLAVLAHPAAGSFPGDSHYKEVLPELSVVETILPEFLELGIAGLEVYYPGHTPECRNILLEWCKKYNLIVTGGSDCHDDTARILGVDGIGQQDYDLFMDKLS